MGFEFLAYVALAVFPLFAYQVFQRYAIPLAASIVVVTGSILLPERAVFDLPSIPPLGKEYVTYLSLLLAALGRASGSIRSARLGRGPEAVFLLACVSVLGTAWMNPKPLFDEGRLEPGLGLYWVIAAIGDDLLTLGLPLFLGRALFRSTRDLLALMATLAVAGALYLIPIGIEVLLSIPFKVFQLSDLIFGIPMRPQFRWRFTQPLVFMDNGLSLAAFMASTLLAANAFVKARMRIFGRSPYLLRNMAIGGLLLTFNVAGIIYGLGLTVAGRIFPPRRLATLALLMATFAVVYPTLRILDAAPYEPLISFVDGFAPERAHSLEGRFLEEEHVLGEIGDRLFFGWGNIPRIPGAETFGSGEVGLDGWWTIQLGMRGMAGVAIYFGVMAFAVLTAFRRMRTLRTRAEQALVAALMSIIAIRLIDLLINGWWNQLPMFLAGALYGATAMSGTRRRASPSIGGGTKPASTSAGLPEA